MADLFVLFKFFLRASASEISSSTINSGEKMRGKDRTTENCHFALWGEIGNERSERKTLVRMKG